MSAFARYVPCDECPWRKDVPVGRFPPERYEALRRSATQGFNPMFACHKTEEGKELACAGYLMSPGAKENWLVRIAVAQRRFDPSKLRALWPMYADHEEMLRANGGRSAAPSIETDAQRYTRALRGVDLSALHSALSQPSRRLKR